MSCQAINSHSKREHEQVFNRSVGTRKTLYCKNYSKGHHAATQLLGCDCPKNIIGNASGIKTIKMIEFNEK